MPETIAYVLKGWPRLSELFIASEVRRLEAIGLHLRLFVLKPRDEDVEHELLREIVSPVVRLPAADSISRGPLLPWLRRHAARFTPALVRGLRRRPIGALRASSAALAQAWRARAGRFSVPRALYLKELLQAFALADAIDAAGDVRHLHAHFCHGTTTVAWLASQILGLSFSFTAHAKDAYKTSLNPAWLLRRKLRAARFAVTCTESTRKHLLAIAPEACVIRVHHGLNAELETLLAGAAPDRTPPDAVRLLGVGRLVEKKGFELAIEALARLVECGIDARLRLVGPDDEAAPGLRARTNALGLGARVDFVGALGQRALLEEYRAASCFVMPCRVLGDGDRDGIPNVLVEAMACGLPVVTTAVGGIEELVADGVDGIVSPADDADALARALVRLHQDRALWSRLSKQGAATVRARFDGERLARELASWLATGIGALR